jgi:hypothetical protein
VIVANVDDNEEDSYKKPVIVLNLSQTILKLDEDDRFVFLCKYLNLFLNILKHF